MEDNNLYISGKNKEDNVTPIDNLLHKYVKPSEEDSSNSNKKLKKETTVYSFEELFFKNKKP